ncbi:MAPEG family protein [Litoribrevibacter albus]|uniref:Membrane protein n=1 Tax=Litoribrevibacter albus TaxID=1473156 RepID=A0AA37SE22_9GAMM|nr:MAPEG family protein [Litoribrevibacter albus]GLQ32823.1 membrane protein [Litoribrevibacter albus]
MTVIVSVMIFAILMIVITKAPVALAMAKQEKGYDNRYPREQQKQLTGFGQRALAAHLNHFESLPVFIGSLVMALIATPDVPTIETLALTYAGARIAYTLCYWADVHWLRSLSWAVGFGSCIGLLVISLP